MRCCSICGKEQLQGPICDNCGFDFSCDYESHRTLCSTLPKQAEPVAVRAAKWKQQQQQVIAVSPADLVCPKCGGKHFWFQIDELQFMCTDCETKMPIAIQRDRSAGTPPAVLVLLVDGIGSRTERDTAEAMPPSAAKNNKESNRGKKAPTQKLKRTSGPTIAAGYEHTIGLKSDGTVVAVGDNEAGQCGVAGWKDIVAVAAGGYHTVGLRSGGTMVVAGSNGSGQCNVQAWMDIMAVTAGGLHTVGLKSDGTVAAVGSNGSGRCNVDSWTDIVSITAGNSHTVGLKSNGTVAAAGVNSSGQCDVNGWTYIVAVAAGENHTVGLKADGTVVAIGQDRYDQCSVAGWTDIVAIVAGPYHTVGLKADGTVVATGSNGHGQCDVIGWRDIHASRRVKR